jgi:hypothetical protein
VDIARSSDPATGTVGSYGRATVRVEATGQAEGRNLMVLVRGLLGDVLRRKRLRQGRTLREVSADARVSLGYLSEVERGQKEASSELLAAICMALDVPLSTVFAEVSEDLAREEALVLAHPTIEPEVVASAA